ncbi:unnamed protein product [Lathyrus sativus]|nr:unnamed protein product [Lathyrus sativus]
MPRFINPTLIQVASVQVSLQEQGRQFLFIMVQESSDKKYKGPTKTQATKHEEIPVRQNSKRSSNSKGINGWLQQSLRPTAEGLHFQTVLKTPLKPAGYQAIKIERQTHST